MQPLQIGIKLNKTDGIVLSLFVVAALCFALAAYKERAQNQLTLSLAIQGKYNALSADVIGVTAHSRGPLGCPFTLVEFGDYQCGPCRVENARVENLLHGHESELRLVFRNLPLISIHPLAMRAAIVAERSKSPSQFWAIHDLFYSKTALDQGKILRAEELLNDSGSHPIEDISANNIIDKDMNEAAALGIQGTPTFVLCCPDGSVHRVVSLDQVASLIRRP